MDIFNILQAIGFILGLIYLWYEYRADAKLWIVAAPMTCIHMWVYYTKGLYGDFCINIYYLVMAVYGYIAWTFNLKREKKEEKPVRHTPWWGYVVGIPALCIIWWLIWWALTRFTDSTVPVMDAFTTALSIVATWMLAQKWAEQWIGWLIADAVYTYLYIAKGIPLYAILYGIYTLVAILGYVKWLRIIRKKF